MRSHAAQVHSVSVVSPREKRKYLRPRHWRSFLPGIGSARSAPMKNNDDIPTTDTTEIKRLINRVKQGELDQGDAQLIEKLLNFLLTIVSLLQRKHASIRRMKKLLFGMKEKKEDKRMTVPDHDASPQGHESLTEEEAAPGNDSEQLPCSGSSPGTVRSSSADQKPKRPGHGRMAASAYTGAEVVNRADPMPGKNERQCRSANIFFFSRGLTAETRLIAAAGNVR